MTERGAARGRGDNRMIAVLLALVATACLGYAAVSRQWLYNPRTATDYAEIGFGPRGMFECANHDLGEGTTQSDCRSMSNSELVAEFDKLRADAKQRANDDPTSSSAAAFAMQADKQFHTSGAFPTFGWLALAGCAIAALSLLVGAILALARKRIDWPVMPTTTALLGAIVGLVTGCVFVALKPGPAGYVGVNAGFFTFGAGIVLGIASALMLNKVLRPLDPDLLADTMHAEDY